MPRKLDAYEQLLNVMEGYTAEGRPRGKPLVLPGGNLEVAQIGLMVSVLLRDFESHLPDELRSDRVRTAIILVFVRWLKLTRITTHRRLHLLQKRVTLSTAH